MKKIKQVVLNMSMFLSYFIFQFIPIIVMGLYGINNATLIITYLIYLLFVVYIYRKELKIDYINLKFKNIIKYIPIYMIGIILMALSNYFLGKITNISIASNEETVRLLIEKVPIYMCFSTCIFAPIVEEIIFRKTIKNIFTNKYLFIILSGLIFGLIHLSFTRINLNELLMIIPYVIMGIDFAYIYHKSNNIFTTITLHTIHNLILLIIQFVS